MISKEYVKTFVSARNEMIPEIEGSSAWFAHNVWTHNLYSQFGVAHAIDSHVASRMSIDDNDDSQRQKQLPQQQQQ